MVKQNTKSSRKISKTNLAKRLEKSTKKVIAKNKFFVVKNKSELYDVVELATKNPIFKNVGLSETANIISKTLKRTPRQNLSVTIEKIHEVLCKHENDMMKHYNDIIFYKHTLRTTKDIDKFYVIESRIEMSLGYFKHKKDTLHSYIHPVVND